MSPTAWRGPYAGDPNDDPRFYGTREFQAATEGEAIRLAQDFYRRIPLFGHIEVELCETFDEMEQSVTDLSRGLSNVIRIYPVD